MIEELNNMVWCSLAPSPIHGIGVFAIRDIPKGTLIGCRRMGKQWFSGNLDVLIPEIRTIVLQRWPLAEKGEPFVCPNDDARLLSFMNHSSNPNYDKYTDTVLRDIDKGEEITENYGPEVLCNF